MHCLATSLNQISLKISPAVGLPELYNVAADAVFIYQMGTAVISNSDTNTGPDYCTILAESKFPSFLHLFYLLLFPSPWSCFMPDCFLVSPSGFITVMVRTGSLRKMKQRWSCLWLQTLSSIFQLSFGGTVKKMEKNEQAGREEGLELGNKNKESSAFQTGTLPR